MIIFLFVKHILALPLSSFELASSFNSHDSNLTAIQLSLETHKNLTALGEFWLLGFPISADNPAWSSAPLDSAGFFRRDYSRAIAYFSEAYLKGDPDAAFYLLFIMEHLGHLREFTHFKLPTRNVARLKTRAQASKFSKAHRLAQYKMCVNSQSLLVPYFLENSVNSTCDNCQTALKDAFELATDVIKFIQQTGVVVNLPDDLTQFQLFGSERIIALYESYAADIGIELDLPDRLTILGDNYMFGNPAIGIERNLKRAIKYYTEAGSRNSLENLAVIALTNQQFKEAKELLENAKTQGSAKALNGLGLMHLHGLGVPYNSSLAKSYFEQAASEGVPESVANLGLMHLYGTGVKKDAEKGKKLLLKAANAGQVGAIYALGVVYKEDPLLCPKALQLFLRLLPMGEFSKYLFQANTLFQKGDMEGTYLTYAFGSSLGLKDAQLSLGYLWKHERSPFECLHSLDYCKSFYYMQAGLVHKSKLAFLELGTTLFTGFEGAPPNYDQAYMCYTLSKEYPEALLGLAYMNQYGLGLPRDLETAEELYRAAIVLGIEEEKYPAYISLYYLKVTQELERVWTLLKEYFNFF